ncbi:hypothetical protein A2154_01465 [Candidatus Gottesmanbacteria bacterium RBG_16_43_7]|uniref:Uncharacterized protein n=1 Tax=Candidatus Gottesmanbacteria bacterium RBG_16_43_7 TaxID=1798373 RepID=A0A1F5ZBU0_9BACT|nr:MAG: hypothetical protein A2154_01465 [Candidatus Gottesmanbacteria bacterium RBG_16_43_7]
MAVSVICGYLYEKLDYVRQILFYGEDEKLKSSVDDYFIYFPRGWQRTEADLILDVTKEYDTKVAAMKSHKSQKKDADWTLKNFQKFLKEEYFQVFHK